MFNKVKLNKWHFILGLNQNYHINSLRFTFGLFKVSKFADPGYVFTKSEYKGFLFDKILTIHWNIFV